MIYNKRGFTLIEVMVALTLLGVVATMLVAGTRLSLDISARGNARTEAMRAEQLARDLVRSQLQSALPFHYWTREENKRVEHIAFEGEPARIRFVSREGIVDGPQSLPRWVELSVQTSANGASKLVVEERRILPPDNQPGETITGRAEMLSCGDVRLEYLDAAIEKPQWFSAWSLLERKAPLPSAVRIQCKNGTTAMRLLVPLDYAEPARQGLAIQ